MKNQKLRILTFIILVSTLSTSVFAKDNNREDSETILTTPNSLSDYSYIDSKVTTGEHFMINTLIGAFSGAIFATMGSFSNFIQHNYAAAGIDPSSASAKSQRGELNKSNLLLFVGIGGLSGGVSGLLLTLFEKDTPFSIARPLLDYAWYGAIAGSFLGAMAGLIPFSSSKYTDDIWHFTGYGSIAGLAIGIFSYYFLDKEKPSFVSTKINYNFDPLTGSNRIIVSYRY